ncbi:alkaline phosphatase D [Chitinivorax tropicus]|uniref:Alkaline phosphatase D n=1 Tax=Chitinivorax tropicus TaxID=714531 RepID=A0A840MM99_9PROT|nr:alkaline phosphatase D family protein [Chitinivorax tropicus]MBB5019540.1 alkaline phosphatase D [Chitinivorax tropicus]
MDRRSFLKFGGFLTVSAATTGLTGCGSDGGSSPAPGAGKVYSFPQGVASGDPKEGSIILWTRVTRNDGSAADINFKVQVSKTADFANLIVDFALVAKADWDFTIRHKVTGLEPATTYYYRFVAGDDASTTGRTKTAPKADADLSSLKFAYVSCQDWSVNHWAAFDELVNEDIDFIVHLGDYIYETVGESFQTGAVEGAHSTLTLPNGTVSKSGKGKYATTLADYRYLYKQYRTDPRLQALHAKFPFVAIWDDHEFSDDCWGDHQTYTTDNPQQTDRRKSATQAWYEFMPADVTFDATQPDFSKQISNFRDLQFGKLMHLIVTDQRLFRTDHVIPETLSPLGEVGSRYFVKQSDLAGAEAKKMAAATAQTGSLPGGPFPLAATSILGEVQRGWWKQKMATSTAAWKVWVNEVSLLRMQVNLATLAQLGVQVPDAFKSNFILNADQWDGFNAERKDMMGFLKTNGVKNVVAITGDIHAFFAGSVMDDFDAATPTPVMVDLVTAGISSNSFQSYFKSVVSDNPTFAPLADLVYKGDVNTFDFNVKAFNPWIVHADTDAQGYAVVTLTPEKMVTVFKKVGKLSNGRLPVQTIAYSTRLTVNRDVPAVVVG